jgi:hypothetical protein
LRGVAAVGAAALVESGVGCHGGGSGGGGGNTGEGGGGTRPADFSDVVYDGGATDEALLALAAEPLSASPSEAAALIMPSPGAIVPASSTSTFQWAVGSATAALTPRAPTTPRARSGPARSGGAIFASWGPREALAHGTPISGRAYFVVFATKKGTPVLRLFTTLLEFTPDAPRWAQLAQAGSIVVSITNAIFDQNRVAPDGGPYRGPSVELSIA